MENKHLYLCRKCHTWLSGPPEEAEKGCPQCEGALTPIMSYDEWIGLRPDEKEEIKKKHLYGKIALDENYEYAPAESDKSIWILILKIVSWVIFAAFVLAGIVVSELLIAVSMASAILSFLIFLCIGCMSVASAMVFLGMAQDVRTIRSRMKK